MIQHPMISQIERTGYPNGMEEGLENVISQPECSGVDVYGFEVIEGDEIAVDQDNFDEIILKENIKRYCVEKLNFIFERGWVKEPDGDFFRERWLEQVLHEEYNFKFTQAE